MRAVGPSMRAEAAAAPLIALTCALRTASSPPPPPPPRVGVCLTASLATGDFTPASLDHTVPAEVHTTPAEVCVDFSGTRVGAHGGCGGWLG